ncbi:aspartate aminotransferase family protein [Lentibacillus salicampi]|uniref:glutamate-1-semialdehyde 2,1-aminomutase n=1 Tax=Lentibacillus salicampi TaxID=175306 RepID=A0A4Y9A8E1_9BACI|nr:aspartate aminotransferase family protein [Lentibacillus salicampi]TFJ92096.1 aspartate aminotransferase family protein [Lentibacillus salicampi]
MKYDKSEALHKDAMKTAPGGTHTANRYVDPHFVFKKANGAYIYDADDNKYIDYQAAFGPFILGHNYKTVNDRVFDVLQRTDLFGVGTTDLEIELANKLNEHIPSVDQVLFCNAGSEATYHAIRLSRAVTERKKIIKFQGCYHGWHDYVARNMLSDWDKVMERDPGSAGILDEAIDNTLVCRFNDLGNVKQTLEENKDEVAAIILEPIPHNIGCIMPQDGFLQGLRDLADENGIILIFDEIITGFRHGLGGFQEAAGVTPDLTTFGKAMANGFPMAAIGGKKKYMERFNTNPGGDVWFAGTFNGHAVGTAASLATIEMMENEPVHDHIFNLGDRMRNGLREIYDRLGIESYVTGYGSVYTSYFMNFEPKNYLDLKHNDGDFYVKYRRKLIDNGVFEMPVNLKRNHISYSHTKGDIDTTLEISEKVLKEMIK